MPTKYQGATPAVLKGICSCGFCKNSMTVTSTTNRANTKYYYYKCTLKNDMGAGEDHNPKDLSVTVLDDFVVETIKCVLVEPELLSAMKKRLKFEGEDQVKELTSRIKRIQQAIKSLKKDKTNALKLVTDNAKTTLRETYESQLESIVLNIQEKVDELNFLEEQLIQVKLSKPIGKNAYQEILNDFLNRYYQSDVQTKRELTKILIKNVESFVNQKTDDGTISIKYVADKRLEADWAEKKTYEQSECSQVWDGWLPGLDSNQRPIG